MMREPPSLAANDDGRPARWPLVVVLMLVASYAFVDRVVLSLLVDPIKHDLHASDLQMSLLLGLAFALFYGGFSIPSGILADRLNRRRLIAVAGIGWALMTIVCGTATTVTQLFVGRAGVGLMEAALTPAAFSLIRDAVPARSRGLAFSFYALAPILGGAVALAVGGLLLRTAVAGGLAHVPVIGGLAPWQAVLVCVGLAGMPWSLLVLTVAEPPREHRGDDARPVGVLRGLADACRYIAAHRALYAPLLVFAGVGAMMSFSYNSWLLTALARRFALPPHQVGPVLGSISLFAGAGGLIFGGWTMNRLTRRGGNVMPYGVVAVIGTAIGIGGACLAPSPPIAFACATLGIFFLGISNPAGATTLSQATPPAMIGRVSAVYLLIQTLVGQTLGPLGVALASQHLFAGTSAIGFGLTLVQAGCAAVAAICGLLLIRYFRRLHARSPDPAQYSE